MGYWEIFILAPAVQPLLALEDLPSPAEKESLSSEIQLFKADL